MNLKDAVQEDSHLEISNRVHLDAYVLIGIIIY